MQRGYRSGLEDKIAQQLIGNGIKPEYETVTITYRQPEKRSRYTPDFILPNGIVIETKGRFLSSDRQKHKWIRDQHPDLDIRFVFSNSRARLNKQSETTYADWCDKYQFKYADKFVPPEWLSETADQQRLDAINKASIN